MSIFRSQTLLYLVRKLRLPKDTENVKTTIENIRSGAYMSGVSLWVLVAAIFIASLGLNVNSTAVIIGAMLISPLMGPIMGFGLGLGINDFALVKKSVRNYLISVVISILTSVTYFFISPVKEAGSELLARTSPTLYDVLIALFGGIAGIIAGASVLRRSNVIPGVAIATALMPPLCTVGYGLANGNISYALGALYLFLINSVFISIATYLIVRLLQYPQVTYVDADQRKRTNWIISTLVALMILPSVYFTYHIVKKYVYQRNASRFVKEQVESSEHIVVSSKLDYEPGNSKLELILMGNTIDSTNERNLRDSLKKYDLNKCRLILYQGPDSRVAAQSVFNELSTGIQMQNISIQDLYLQVDSLWSQLHKQTEIDTLEATVSRAWYELDSNVQHVGINRQLYFNPAMNKADTAWLVNVRYTEEGPRLANGKVDSLLRANLKTGNIDWKLE